MIYDCIIAGAGPAGSFCGYLLSKSGYSCLILEKLQQLGEKTCGGWLPDIALQELYQEGIDMTEYSHWHGLRTKSCLTVKGEKKHLYTYPEDKFGIGTTRKELDCFLAEQAQRAGCEIRFGEPVQTISCKGNLYKINGYEGKTFVAASGVCGLLHGKTQIYKNQTFGISAQIYGESILDQQTVYFWYENENTKDYFWAIPIGEKRWNIGFWTQHSKRKIKEKFYTGLKQYIDLNFKNFTILIPPKGAYLGNCSLLDQLPAEAFAVGDFAGVNNINTGEGLSFAFRSSRKVSRQIKKKLAEQKYERMELIYEEGYNILFFCDRIQYCTVTDSQKEAIRQLQAGEGLEAAVIKSGLSIDSVRELEKKIIKREVSLAMDIKTSTVRLTFNVSNCCNMACGYCYAQGGTYHSEENKMSVDTAKKALDLFYAQYKVISSIKFIGGEPAMNLDVVEYICQYQKEKMDRGEIKKLPEFIFVTNGTIVNDRVIQLYKKYGVKIGISFDGPSFINDQVRVMKNGQGSSSLVIKNIKKLQEATEGKQPYSVNAVYTSAEEKAGISITQIMHYVRDELHVPSIHIIPVDVSEDSVYALSDNKEFTEAADELLKQWRETGTPFFFHNLNGMIKKIKKRLYSPDYICDAGFGLFSISADGKIYPCHLFTDLEEFSFGHVGNFDFHNESFMKLSKELREYNRRSAEPCKSCFANRICIGCLGSNYFRSGNKYTPAPFICHMFCKVAKRVIAELAVQEKGGNREDAAQ